MKFESIIELLILYTNKTKLCNACPFALLRIIFLEIKGLDAYVSTNHRFSNVSSVPKGLKIVITLRAYYNL